MIREELDAIRKKNGGLLRPEDVVKAAKNPRSPLHARFNWDDTSAAHAWRLEQARHLIRVFVTVMKTKGGNIESRMFVALSGEGAAGGYRVLTDVLEDAGMRAMLLSDAYDDMRRFRQKYSALKELTDVFVAMDKRFVIAS